LVDLLVLYLEELLIDVLLLSLGSVDVFLKGVVYSIGPREEVTMSNKIEVRGLQLVGIRKDLLVLSKGCVEKSLVGLTGSLNRVIVRMANIGKSNWLDSMFIVFMEGP
jgi:hypothetical protein